MWKLTVKATQDSAEVLAGFYPSEAVAIAALEAMGEMGMRYWTFSCSEV